MDKGCVYGGIWHGMNITFSKAGYTYSGCLINNTNIAGRIESMNIWHTRLQPEKYKGSGRSACCLDKQT